MAFDWSVINEAVTNLMNAARGDVSAPLADIAQRAGNAELSDDNAFSQLLADLVPGKLREFNEAAESALSAAADFADALAEAVDAATKAYEEADRAASEELLRLTEELKTR